MIGGQRDEGENTRARPPQRNPGQDTEREPVGNAAHVGGRSLRASKLNTKPNKLPV